MTHDHFVHFIMGINGSRWGLIKAKMVEDTVFVVFYKKLGRPYITGTIQMPFCFIESILMLFHDGFRDSQSILVSGPYQRYILWSKRPECSMNPWTEWQKINFIKIPLNGQNGLNVQNGVKKEFKRDKD